MRSLFINTFLFFFLVFSGTCLRAAHLVGGQISYKCLGNNVYEIRLRIYRDCASGGAQFDAVAEIAVYDIGNNLIMNLTPAKGPTVNVPPDSTGNPCVSAPPGLCTEYAEYKDTVTLPPIAGGYILTHQRCCRNASIVNVNNSGSFGNTYTIRIPDMDTTCNSSAEFLGVAPIVICLNKPLNLPLNVSENDGDSLYFELCDVLNGGSSGGGGCLATIPSPPCPPPYQPVPFQAPFTSSNPMPSNPQFSIDPNTGVIQGTPTQIGQYLVGICVTEFRNGLPLSTVRLDYQFNVSNCISNVVSDMVTPAEDPTIVCDGLHVNFISESKNATRLHWDFGDLSTKADTSNDPNPSYSYNIAGTYLVTLYANPGLPCGDTIQVPFTVKPRVEPDFTINGLFCFQSQNVNFQPMGYYPPNATFEWDFGADANISVSNDKVPPSIQWSTAGKHYVTLTVKYDACTKVKRDSLEISSVITGVDAGPSQSVREGDIVYLNGSGGSTYYWTASAPVNFGNPFGATTTVYLREEDDTVTFYLKVLDALGCEGIDSTQVFVIREVGIINFISPNNDGRNDVYDLSTINPDGKAHISILNRWGSEVFYQDEYANDWRGVNRGGNELPDGTYYCILTLGNKLIYKGPVTIIRSP